MATFKDLAGHRLGKLVVVCQIGKTKSNAVVWLCRCDCGNEIKVVSADINRNKFKTCGKCVRTLYDKKVIDNGMKFNRWTIIDAGYKVDKGNLKCLCECECGTQKAVYATQLVSGQTKSCGCLQKEMVADRSKTHNEHKTRLYYIWSSMKQRCQNPKTPGYKNYGARGISVCEEWLDYISFRCWALDNGYDDNLTIERINVNGNYEPGNVTFVTSFDQHSNRRDNKFISHNGQTKTVEQWSRVTGIPAGTIRNRYIKGLDSHLILFKGHLRDATQ